MATIKDLVTAAVNKVADEVKKKKETTASSTGTQQTSAGSSTASAGGSSAPASNAGMSSYVKSDSSRGTSTNYGTYKEDLDRVTAAQRQAQVDQLKAARKKALANLDVQEQNIKPMYQTARNQTAAASQQGARSFAEYLANRGLTNSGAAAQGEINRLSALNNNLGNLNTAEANAYRDIANQRTAVENEYVAGLANANNALTNNYYNNLLNYNNQQRQYVQQLQNQALGQYSGDYQAYKNSLLAQGYDPNSLEVLSIDAARGTKMNNANANTYNYQNSMNRILSGTWNYNDLLATGLTNEQATRLSTTSEQERQAQQDMAAEQLAYDRRQQELTNQINLQKLANATAETQYKINEPYNTTVYHVSSGGGNKSTPTTVNTKMIEGYLSDIKQDKNLTTEQKKQAQREYLDGLYALNDDSVIDDKTYKDYYAYYGLMN